MLLCIQLWSCGIIDQVIMMMVAINNDTYQLNSSFKYLNEISKLFCFQVIYTASTFQLLICWVSNNIYESYRYELARHKIGFIPFVKIIRRQITAEKALVFKYRERRIKVKENHSKRVEV